MYFNCLLKNAVLQINVLITFFLYGFSHFDKIKLVIINDNHIKQK